MHKKNILAACSFLLILSLSAQAGNKKSYQEWISLFNSKDLSGWDIKIKDRPLNDNYNNTFRVENAMLRVSYDRYEKFENKFGHIYHKIPFSYYKLKFQYRFVGTAMSDAPVWAHRNSGVMIHSQSAQSMALHQDFPVSLEMQLLAGSGNDETSTGNICTPGTEIHIQGVLQTDHCINSTSKTYYGEQWVNAMVEVYGDSLIRHIINGDTVLTYTKPIIDREFVSETHNWTAAQITDSLYWIKKAGSPLAEGYIAFQAESQRVDFRNVELLNLAGCMDPKSKNYKDYYIKSDNSQCTH